jgi:2'-5' RNA ligase
VGADALEERSRPEVAPRVRAFFGLPLPDAQRDSLAAFVAGCIEAAPQFRWTPAANLHLTLRFIGSVDRTLVEGIADRVAERAPAGFGVELGDLDTFKRGRLVRVVWLGLRSGLEPLARLAAEVEDECDNAGLPAEKRPLRAHLTLARAKAKDGAILPALPPAPKLEPWRADELVLYSSHLGRTGSVYEPLRLVKLD